MLIYYDIIGTKREYLFSFVLKVNSFINTCIGKSMDPLLSNYVGIYIQYSANEAI